MATQTVEVRAYPRSHAGPGIYVHVRGPKGGTAAYEKLDRYTALKLAEDLVKAVAEFEAGLIRTK